MSAVLSFETVVKRTERVPFTLLDDELLAIDVQQGFVYSLNETGQRVWDAIAQPASVRDISLRLTECYEVDEATSRQAVITLLGQLCEAGLAEVVDESR